VEVTFQGGASASANQVSTSVVPWGLRTRLQQLSCWFGYPLGGGLVFTYESVEDLLSSESFGRGTGWRRLRWSEA
jgi:hypothetical protein